MADCIVMPKAGVSVETCIMGEWLKAEGDFVEKDEIVFTYETDKSVFEYRALESGYLLKQLVAVGDDVPVLTPVCYMGQKGEAVPAGESASAAPEAAPAEESAARAELPADVKVIVMPKAGVSVETCIMGEWLKAEGDYIEKDELVFTYETDKSVFEYRAVESGYLLKKLVEAGDDVPVLEPVYYMGEQGTVIGAVAAAPAGAAAPAAVAPAAAAPAAAPAAKDGKLRISPRAKKLAENMGLRGYEGIAGTGPNGRIIERDIRAYAKTYVPAEEKAAVAAPAAAAPVKAAAPAPAVEVEYEDKPLSGIRKAIARNMHNSLSTMAQLTHSTTFDATEVLALRKKLKGAQDTIGAISVNDIMLYAVSRVLLRHPDLNANYLDDKMRYFKHVHLGMAVDTPRGLLVPTIFNADTKSLAEIAKETKALAAACQDGTISPDQLKGASFTVTNLGPFGMEHFTPVINPPQTGILGVCATVDRVRKVNGEIDIYPAMGLSLTYDHRALDGAPASRFLQELVRELENVVVLLAQ